MKQPEYDAVSGRRKSLPFILYRKKLSLDVNKHLDPRMKLKLIGENFGKISNSVKIFVSENICLTECFFLSAIVPFTYLWKHHRNSCNIYVHIYLIFWAFIFSVEY